MLNTDSKGFLVENLQEFNKEHSPSIPPGFPPERIPSELCKHALTEMMLCLVNNQQNLCGYQTKIYYICKKERDAKLFTQIQHWELNDVYAAVNDKKAYVDDLEAQRKALAGQFEKTTASIGNKHRRWRMAADLEQLKWRIGYLRERQ